MRRSKNFSLLAFAAIFVLFTGLLSYFATPAWAVPAAPGVHIHVQSDGKVVFYVLHGDEIFNYATNSNGDLIASGNDGDLYYANWASESNFWESDTPKLVVKTSRIVNGVPSNTKTPEYYDMLPLKTPVPEYISKYVQKIRRYHDNPELPTTITVTLPGGIKEIYYNKTIYVQSHITPISCTIDNGTLPDGLSLSGAGVISGTPTSEGTFNFTVKATNSEGSDTQDLSIRVASDINNSDSGGGCNSAAGYVMVIFTVLPLLCKRRK